MKIPTTQTLIRVLLSMRRIILQILAVAVLATLILTAPQLVRSCMRGHVSPADQRHIEALDSLKQNRIEHHAEIDTTHIDSVIQYLKHHGKRKK